MRMQIAPKTYILTGLIFLDNTENKPELRRSVLMGVVMEV